MSFPSWVQNRRSSLPPNRGQHRRRGSFRAATHRLNVEVLEDRVTPSLTFSGYLPWDQYPYEAVVSPPPPPLSADVTSDGIPDLVYPTENSSLGYVVAVRPGRGDGTFGNPIYSPATTGLGLALADFNADGQPDVFMLGSAGAASDFGPSAVVLLGRRDGTFHLAQTADLGLDTVLWYGTGDIDGDGRPDAAIAGIDYGGEYAVMDLLNDGNWPQVPPPPPPVPSLTIHDSTVAEGNAGTVAATFSLTLSVASSQPVTVAYTTADGSAKAGSDYQAASGTLTFAPGETSKTVSVLVNGDRLAEPNETFNVKLSSPTNANISNAQGVGTILDDEPRISIGDVSKKEGKNGLTTLFTFTVTLSAAYDQPVTMSFRTVDGTATTSDSDYIAKTGTLTFAPGETTKTITIEVNGDSKKEANESFYLDLFGNSCNSLFTKNRGIGTILNDD